MNIHPDPLEPVAQYYSDKVTQHGATPAGVDWNGSESQTLRFQQLCKVILQPEGFTLADVGCGYGALYEYIKTRYTPSQYIGLDISEEMIRLAKVQHTGDTICAFYQSSEISRPVDYGIASGIFNVMLDQEAANWETYVLQTLHSINRQCHKGFSFNCLTSYSDPDKMQPYLYYADPRVLFDYCKQNFSKNIALLHDYGLFEFTVIVRKEL